MPSEIASPTTSPFNAVRPAGGAASLGNRKLVSSWLLLLAFMIWVMVGIGGYTRDSGSGLSIMKWEPIIGVLPPLSLDAWNKVFALYKTIPQYQLLHQGMDLAGFKQLFWPEYFHRLWGRLMGAVLLLPLIVFALTGRIETRLIKWLVLLFLLGGLQGFIGWYMVSSGFRPDSIAVEGWRLSLHFFGAMFLFGAVLWTALVVRAPEPVRYEGMRGPAPPYGGGLRAAAAGHVGRHHGLGHSRHRGFQHDQGYRHRRAPARLADDRAAQQRRGDYFWPSMPCRAGGPGDISPHRARIARRGPGPVRDGALLVGRLVILQFVLGVTALVSGRIDIGVVHQLNAVLLMGALAVHALPAARGDTIR